MSLPKKWQTLFLKNGIPDNIALLICSLPLLAQKELYKDQVNKDEAKKKNPQVFLNTNLIKKYKGDLSMAVFDLKDTELDKKSRILYGLSFQFCYCLTFSGGS